MTQYGDEVPLGASHQSVGEQRSSSDYRPPLPGMADSRYVFCPECQKGWRYPDPDCAKHWIDFHRNDTGHAPMLSGDYDEDGIWRRNTEMPRDIWLLGD